MEDGQRHPKVPIRARKCARLGFIDSLELPTLGRAASPSKWPEQLGKAQWPEQHLHGRPFESIMIALLRFKISRDEPVCGHLDLADHRMRKIRLREAEESMTEQGSERYDLSATRRSKLIVLAARAHFEMTGTQTTMMMKMIMLMLLLCPSVPPRNRARNQ